MSRTEVARTKLQWFTELRGAELSHAEFRVAVVLATFSDASMENAYPGVARLAADAQVSEPTLKRALRALQEKGWVRLTQRGGNQFGKGRANVYALSSPASKGGSQLPPSSIPKGVSQLPPTGVGKGVTQSIEGGKTTTPQGGNSVTPHQVLTTPGEKNQVSSHVSNAREGAVDQDRHSEVNPLGWIECELPQGFQTGERQRAEQLLADGTGHSRVYYQILEERRTPKPRRTTTTV